MYVKVDDDIVYIHPKAIFNMVKMKLTTNFIFISANVVNHAAVSKYHVVAGVFSVQQISDQYDYEIKKGFTDIAQLPRGEMHFDGDAWGDHSWRSGN